MDFTLTLTILPFAVWKHAEYTRKDFIVVAQTWLRWEKKNPFKYTSNSSRTCAPVPSMYYWWTLSEIVCRAMERESSVSSVTLINKRKSQRWLRPITRSCPSSHLSIGSRRRGTTWSSLKEMETPTNNDDQTAYEQNNRYAEKIRDDLNDGMARREAEAERKNEKRAQSQAWGAWNKVQCVTIIHD